MQLYVKSVFSCLQSWWYVGWLLSFDVKVVVLLSRILLNITKPFITNCYKTILWATHLCFPLKSYWKVYPGFLKSNVCIVVTLWLIFVATFITDFCLFVFTSPVSFINLCNPGYWLWSIYTNLPQFFVPIILWSCSFTIYWSICFFFVFLGNSVGFTIVLNFSSKLIIL
jgi:hypothetical protein